MVSIWQEERGGWEQMQQTLEEFYASLTQEEHDMGLTAKGDGGEYEACPAGTHLARCYGVYDLGHQTGEYGTKHQCLIAWELPKETMQDGRPFAVSKFYTLSLNEKANLHADLVAWRGRAFTPDELEAFDVFKILGAPAQVTVVHNENGKAKVAQVAKVMKGLVIPDQVNPSQKFSFEDGGEPSEDIPEWIRNVIAKSPEASGESNVAQFQNPADAAENEFDDDIPFAWVIGAIGTGLGGWALVSQDMLQVLA